MTKSLHEAWRSCCGWRSDIAVAEELDCQLGAILDKVGLKSPALRAVASESASAGAFAFFRWLQKSYALVPLSDDGIAGHVQQADEVSVQGCSD